MSRRYRTARAVLRYEDRYLLAVHSSFWARRERRWGLPGGGIERGEDPLSAVRRELHEELELHLSHLTEIGAYFYKGNDHIPADEQKLMRGRLNKITKGEVETPYPVSDLTEAPSR